jgi:uncharacterized membrane protein YccF (DUF307 family)
MRFLLNIIWLVLAGILMAIAYVIAGAILCLTIIGIPFRKAVVQARWLCALAVRENAHSCRETPQGHLGRRQHSVACTCRVVACAWAPDNRLSSGLTIIGIPLGVASFKMAGGALFPFGKEIVRTKDLRAVPAGAVVVDAGDSGAASVDQATTTSASSDPSG